MGSSLVGSPPRSLTTTGGVELGSGRRELPGSTSLTVSWRSLLAVLADLSISVAHSVKRACSRSSSGATGILAPRQTFNGPCNRPSWLYIRVAPYPMPIIRPAGCASQLPGPGCAVTDCTPSAPSLDALTSSQGWAPCMWVGGLHAHNKQRTLTRQERCASGPTGSIESFIALA